MDVRTIENRLREIAGGADMITLLASCSTRALIMIGLNGLCKTLTQSLWAVEERESDITY